MSGERRRYGCYVTRGPGNSRSSGRKWIESHVWPSAFIKMRMLMADFSPMKLRLPSGSLVDLGPVAIGVHAHSTAANAGGGTKGILALFLSRGLRFYI